MIRFRFLLILILPFFGNAQKQYNDVDFTQVDSLATRSIYNNDIYQLTKTLTDPWPKQLFKARAIFRWITENISYDYKYYNKYHDTDKETIAYTCKGANDCEVKKATWEAKYLEKLLKKKEAICQGYTMLFQKMCTIAGLTSEMIPGFVRTRYYQVGTMGSLDHAWNAVWIDSAYYLIDVTWASGGCAEDEDGKLLSFQRNFNNYYWLTPYKDFARNHFPKTSKWTLLSNFTKDDFAQNPYYYSPELDNIKLITPTKGIINAKKGDTIKLKIEYSGKLNDIQINTNIFRNPDIFTWEDVSKRKRVRTLDTFALKKQQYINYKKDGKVYQFEYIVTDASLYYIDILFNKQRMMRFKVDIARRD